MRRAGRPVRQNRHLPASPAEEISAAVFRYHMRHYAADSRAALTYYLALWGGDPSEAFMQRFRGHQPPVHPRSRCRVSARAGVRDRETGQPGLIVEVTELTWHTETDVDVTGGSYAAPWSAAATRCHVRHEGDRWRVTHARVLWQV